MVLTPSTMLKWPTQAPDFSLPARDGTTVSRDAFREKPLLVMFLCNHCPYVQHLREHLAATCSEYQKKSVGIVGISSNDAAAFPDDSPEKMAEETKSAGYAFLYLSDESQEVAKAYRASCTPDFFLFDRKHQLVYRGQYDDNRPGKGRVLSGRDLRTAMDAVLAGQTVAAQQRPSIGCNVKWRAGHEPEYFSG